MRPRAISILIVILLLSAQASLSTAELVKIESVEELEKVIEGHACYVVGYFENLDSEEAGRYKEAVATLDFGHDFGQAGCGELVTAITSDEGVRKQLGIPAEMGIVMISEGVRDLFVFWHNYSTSVDSIKRWIETTPVPMISEFRTDLIPNIFRVMDPTRYLLLLTSKSSSEFTALNEAFIKAAKLLHLETRFVLVDTDNESNLNYMNSFLGFEKEQGTSIYGLHLGYGNLEQFVTRYLPFVGNITTENIVDYNERLHKRNLKRFLNSEQIPLDWDTKQVKILVGKNFHEVIKGSGKSAFVLFNSPWSPYCKKLEPTWDELGEKFADSEKVLIAKINSVHGLNEVEGVHINGEPTMLFFPAGLNDTAEYSGDRSLDDLVHFLNHHIEKTEKLTRGEL